MSEKYFFWSMYAFAGEALVFGVIILFVLQWLTKPHDYVRSHYPDYYERNLYSPLYAGNKTVLTNNAGHSKILTLDKCRTS